MKDVIQRGPPTGALEDQQRMLEGHCSQWGGGGCLPGQRLGCAWLGHLLPATK